MKQAVLICFVLFCAVRPKEENMRLVVSYREKKFTQRGNWSIEFVPHQACERTERVSRTQISNDTFSIVPSQADLPVRSENNLRASSFYVMQS